MKVDIHKLKKALPSIKENVILAPYTTFKIGGPADLFYEAKSDNEIVGAIKVAQEFKIPYFILGGGSNLLVSDKGIRGLVIKTENGRLEIENRKIMAGVAVPLVKVVDEAAKNSLSGLEFAAGIPGTFGGAIVGNAGAWQKSIGDKLLRVKVLTPAGKVIWIDKKNCQFSYRNSRFKKSQEIILEAELGLEKGNKETIEKKIKENLQKRSSQPKESSAGCIFVNPKEQSAGSLIDQCGLKGKMVGEAQISPKHANFIVNLGKARCVDVLELIKTVKKAVKEKFAIDLKEEIEIVGEF